MAAVTFSPAADVVVSAVLPAGLREVPLATSPDGDEAVADDLLRALHPGWFAADGELLAEGEPYAAAFRERYRATVALRRDSGAALAAVCVGVHAGAYSASLLTVHAVELAYDDPVVAAAGIGRVLVAEGPADAEVMPVALPAGPAVGRVRRRTLRSQGSADGLEIGFLDIHVATGDGLLLVLELVCPTITSFEVHAALAGTVATTLATVRSDETAA